MKQRFDILGLGCTAVDDILYVSRYPGADEKAQVSERQRHCGGLCATALVAAARLGARCAFAGSLGLDEHSVFVLETLRREGIDVRSAARHAKAAPIASVIVVDETRRTRNIFYHPPPMVGAALHSPSKAMIQRARVLMVDRFGIPGMIRAARVARQSGVAVMGDFESFGVPCFRELLALVDHLIVSETFAREFTGEKKPAAAARKLWRKDRAVVVITCGGLGCWFLETGVRAPCFLPAFQVDVVDTTGCGDVFHGAYGASLARGLSLLERLRVASAAAALKAGRRGGQEGAPTWRAVQQFLKRRQM
ncbi:MAG: hypothetical protein QOF48_3744 [Verrucomicrobiota bacterium]|jgi:sugar/nucleoside kinase (ribokinase family)